MRKTEPSHEINLENRTKLRLTCPSIFFFFSNKIKIQKKRNTEKKEIDETRGQELQKIKLLIPRVLIPRVQILIHAECADCA